MNPYTGTTMSPSSGRARDIPRTDWAHFPQAQDRSTANMPASARPCFGVDGWVGLAELPKGDIVRAALGCARCPFLRSCEQDLARAMKDGRKPADQLWAGRFLNSEGKIVKPRQYIDKCVAVTRALAAAGAAGDPAPAAKLEAVAEPPSAPPSGDAPAGEVTEAA